MDDFTYPDLPVAEQEHHDDVTDVCHVCGLQICGLCGVCHYCQDREKTWEDEDDA